jgi:PAS domain S-box-containing protein
VFRYNMSEKRRRLVLLLIMSVVPLTVGGILFTLLLRTTLHEYQDRALDIVQSRARMIESIYEFNKEYGSNFQGNVEEATLSLLLDTHNEFAGFAKTGEFTLAKKEDDKIIFLLHHRHANEHTEYDTISFNSENAEPMRKALTGKSGTLLGKDYRGAIVLAAYEPVKHLNWGLVAKLDLSEFKTPFLKTGLIVLIVTVLLVGLGVIIILRITEPMIKGLEDRVKILSERDKATKDLKLSESKFRRMFESNMIGFHICNMDGSILQANDAYLDTIGYTRQELKEGKLDWKKMTPPEYAHLDNSAAKEISEQGIAKPYEKEYLNKNGKRVWVLLGGTKVDEDPNSGIFFSINIAKRKKAETRLKDRTEFIETILNNQDFGVAVHNTVTNEIVYMNPAFERVYGIKKEEINILDDFFNIVFPDPDYRQHIVNLVDSGIRSGEREKMVWKEIAVPGPVENARYVTAANIPLPSQNLMISTVYDVTNSVRLDEAKEVLLHDFGERVKEINCIYKISESIRCHETKERMFSEIVNLLPEGSHYPEITRGKIVIDDKEYLSDNFRESKWKLTSEIIVNDQVRGRIEIHLLRESPELDIGPFLKEEQNLLNEISKVISGYIIRKSAEEELIEYQRAVEFSEDLIAVVDRDEVYKVANKTYKKYWNLTGDIVGKKVKDVLPDEGYLKGLNISKEKCLNGQTVKAETALFYPTMKIRNVLSISTPLIEKNGEVTGIVFIGRDVTELKRAEEELSESTRLSEETARLASIGVIAAGITHEINQPLNAIRLSADSIMHWDSQNPGVLQPFLLSFLSSITNGVTRISEIVEHMRSYWVKHNKEEFENVEINSCVNSALKLVNSQALDHMINIEMDISPEELNIKAIPVQIEQVVTNLVANAIQSLDSVESGEKKITVSTLKYKNYAVIEVADNGGGLSGKSEKELFDPFYSNKKPGEGMGLGLAIVKMFIENFNGSIGAGNNITGGATFSVKFKLASQD